MGLFLETMIYLYSKSLFVGANFCYFCGTILVLILYMQIKIDLTGRLDSLIS